MAKFGRPYALDEIKRREICALVSAGCGIARAADYVGCNPSTIRREALRNADFHDRLRKAELSAELEPLHLLRKKANTHWRAAAWLLERTNPQRFGKQDVQRLNQDQVAELLEQFVDMLVEEIPDEDLLLQVFQRLGASLRKATHEAFSAERVRRDPHSRRRRARDSSTGLTMPEGPDFGTPEGQGLGMA